MPWTPVQVAAGDTVLDGDLVAPYDGSRCVLVAHGSGSSRLSPRNRAVAEHLISAGLGVLLFDLLTEAEARDRRRVFDIPFLAERLVAATTWLVHDPLGAAARGPGMIGYFGASTGAGAALWAAADERVRSLVGAVVSRGGRPDLAEDRLPQVTAPTLLIVGGSDPVVLDLNRRALASLRCRRELVVVSGASHLFSEPGALEQVAVLAEQWFLDPGNLRA